MEEEPLPLFNFDEFFKSFSSEKDFAYEKQDKKWFNGQFFSPLELYRMDFSYARGKISVKYQIARTDPGSPAVQLGSMSDRHSCTIVYRMHKKISDKKFYILSRSIWSKLFHRKPARYFSAKTKDPVLKKSLQKNVELNKIFYISENSPDFCPSIDGRPDPEEDCYRIYVLYGGEKRMRVGHIHHCIEFCKSMVE